MACFVGNQTTARKEVWKPVLYLWYSPPCMKLIQKAAVQCLPCRNAFTPQPASHVHHRQSLYGGRRWGGKGESKGVRLVYTQHGPPPKALEDGPICGFRIILEVQEMVWRNILIHYCRLKPDLIFLGFAKCPLSVSGFHLGHHVMIIWNVSLGISWLCQSLRYFF